MRQSVFYDYIAAFIFKKMNLALIIISAYALLATVAIVLIVKMASSRAITMFDYNNVIQKRTSTLYFDVDGFLLSDKDSSNSGHVLSSLRTGDNISSFTQNPDLATYLQMCARHRGNFTYKFEETVDGNVVKRIDLVFSPFVSHGELRGVSVTSQTMYSKNREAELLDKARDLANKNAEAQRQIERLDIERVSLESAFKKSSKHHIQLQKAMYRIEMQKQELEQALDIINRQKDELERVNAEISRSNKMKEVFLANTSHEIRTPLNAIIGFTNLLLKMNPNEQQLRYLENIKTSGRNLLYIINDILDLSKIESGKMELESTDFDLRDLVHKCSDALSVGREGKKVTINIDIADAVPAVVVGDPYRTNQILTNLINNSVKFTGDDCIIGLKINLLDADDDKINIGFEVSDNGIGIPKERQSEIFKSFTQANVDTTRKYGGTGLGLSITRQLVEMHGGSISVESEPNCGSTFRFNLIMKKSNNSAVVKSSVDKMQAPLQKLSLLLVEDNEINQQLAIDTLKAWNPNIEIEVASNGQIAVEKVQKAQYDVVLMDVQMPVMDGNAAARAIRSLEKPCCDVPIIAMTAHAFAEERERCLASGMNDYVMKPFDPDDLCAKICKYAGLDRQSSDHRQTGASDADGQQGFNIRLLADACAGDISELQRVVDVYSTSVTADINELMTAYIAGDNEKIRMKHHSLQTAFGYLGIPSATEKLDSARQVSDGTEAAKLVKQIAALWQQTLPLIKDYVAGLEGKA